MNRRPFLALFFLCIILLGTAQTQEIGKPKTRLDPRIYSGVNERGRLGEGKKISISKSGVTLSLRFKKRLEQEELNEFKKRGVIFLRSIKTIYIAFFPWEALTYLQTHPALVYAQSLSLPVGPNKPLFRTAANIGASAVHRASFGNIGEGKVVVDIDSGIDVLHPHFFFADGGRFRWTDVNKNGIFDPQVDGVDLNQDGQISENEKLKVAAGLNFDANSDVGEFHSFESRRDWLYLDRNKDGKRNAGISRGFTEEDLAYGEPIFVVEDVNRNNILDEHEVLVQLGTSKIVKLVTKSASYERGINLISATTDPDEEDFAHGTSVASILLGGQFGFHDRIGIAPGAELVMYRAESEDISYAFAGVMDAIENRHDLILHEWTESIVSPIDGSGNYEALMRVAYQAGIPSINPLGNLNGSGKHLQKEGTGEDSLGILIGDGFSKNAYTSFLASVFWLSAESPEFSLIDPSGKTYDLQIGALQQFDLLNLLTTISTSPRGTQQFSLSVWTKDKSALSVGEWTLEINNLRTLFVGRVGDPFSGWAKGIQWSNPTNEAGSVVFPATADSAFGVAALDTQNSSGILRDFSGRGPRIDGARIVDISSPDDPLTAFASTQNRVRSGLGQTWFSKFGGTSGAAPHVAGAHLLLQGAFPELSLRALEEKLRDSADTSGALGEFGPLPNTHLGAGKINIYKAIFGAPIPTKNRRPVVSAVRFERQIDSSGTTDPDNDPVLVRYDFEHDGLFDTDWLEPGITNLPPDWKNDDIIHVQAQDRWGMLNGVLLSSAPISPSIVGIRGGGFCQFVNTSKSQTRWIWGLVFLFFLTRFGRGVRKPIG